MKYQKALSISVLATLLLLGACGQKKSASDKKVETVKSSQSVSAKKSSKSISSSQKEVAASSSDSENTSQESEVALDKSSETDVLTRLEGTWSAVNVQGYPTTMTIDRNGNMTWTMKNTDTQTDMTGQAQGRPVQVGENLYRWDYISGDEGALLPGVVGIGGAGFKVQLGFKLDKDQYTPVMFRAGMSEDFDYSQMTLFPFSFQKQ